MIAMPPPHRTPESASRRPSASVAPVEIEFVFDTVCPWCFIGKRRLYQALALRPHVPVQLLWRPFLINPEMPDDGVDRQTDLIRKFGSESRVRRIFGAISEAGLSVQIDFAFERILRTPNALDSHRLVMLAADTGKAAEVVEALYQAFFRDGRDIGAIENLVDVAGACGMDVDSTREFLTGDVGREKIRDENARAHRLGVNGVPSFVFNGDMVIAGAQEPQVLARMLDAATATAGTGG